MLHLLLFACTEPATEPMDRDQDGFNDVDDCNDRDADAFPGAIEFCDGRDNNCDGEVDEAGSWGERSYFVDSDGDGFGTNPRSACEQPADTVLDGGDCDDADPTVNPGAEEACNGTDDNCNGVIDDAMVWPDLDGDGFATDGPNELGCDLPNFSRIIDDCDDAMATVFPGAPELCNGIDDDCDGLIDDEDADVHATTVWFPDADQDGFGTGVFSQTLCDPGPGWVVLGGDCDDFEASVHPQAPERCDGVDQDCDGVPDGPDAAYALGASRAITLIADELNPIFIEPVDLGGPGDSLVVAFGDCDGGFEVMPTRHLPGEVFGLEQPVLVVSYEGALHGARTGVLYLHANPVGAALALQFAEGTVAAERGGVPWFDQAIIRPGVHTPSGLLALDGPEISVNDAHPSVSLATFTGVTSNASGSIGWTTRWATIHGSDAVYTHTRIEAHEPTLLGPVPDPVRWLALEPEAAFTSMEPLAFGDLTVEVVSGAFDSSVHGTPQHLQLGITPPSTASGVVLVDAAAILGRDRDPAVRSLELGP